MVSLRNSYAKANDMITLFSIQMQMSINWVIVTAIVIMADTIIICHDLDCGDNTLMHAHLHLNEKKSVIILFALAYEFRNLTNLCCKTMYFINALCFLKFEKKKPDINLSNKNKT